MTFTFNTGRLYTAQGQIIEAMIVKTVVCDDGFANVTIQFNDTSRMIKGEFTTLQFDDIIMSLYDVKREVMAAYDSGRYVNI